MATFPGLKAIQTSGSANKQHILGFDTARAEDDELLEVWNDNTGADVGFRLVAGASGQPGKITRAVWQATAVGPTYGGTGLTSYTQGDLLYASAANTLAKLAGASADGQVVTWDGASEVPEWRTPAGSLIAETFYRPGVITETAASTSGSFADVDATNLTVTFTAPSSGEVIVQLSACYNNNAAADRALEWNLRSGASDVANTNTYLLFSSLVVVRITVPIKVTGLTPGDSYTYKWGHRANGANMNTSYGGARAEAAMMVWAA